MNSDEFKAAASVWKSREIKAMPAAELKNFVDDFLKKKSVCALATGCDDFVRCTPLEYSYHHGMFWIFTEGGEKFIGLEKNKNVCLAIFESNPGFGQLQSVQITGTANIVEPMSSTYVSHAEFKNIPVATLENLVDQGRPMHLLCIQPIKIDALFSEFKKQGYDSRQVLEFEKE